MEKAIPIRFPTDAEGLTGRECPECRGYFKIKFGTGLPTQECLCPYCSIRGEHSRFFTEDQIEFAKSVAVREALGPSLRELERSLKSLESSTRGGFIQFKVSTSGLDFPLKNYREKDLETHVTCDNCGLEFAIYGVFANCPDCGQLNALTIFSKSIEVARKKLGLIGGLSAHEKDLKEAFLEDALSGGISAFDAFGKALRNKYPEKLPQKPKNLFQNIFELDGSLSELIGKSFSGVVGRDRFAFLTKMFQVRHVYEHNMGVIDNDFIKRIPELSNLRGRKYSLSLDEIDKFLTDLGELGKHISALLAS